MSCIEMRIIRMIVTVPAAEATRFDVANEKVFERHVIKAPEVVHQTTITVSKKPYKGLRSNRFRLRRRSSKKMKKFLEVNKK
jgi:hypothetical protein